MSKKEKKEVTEETVEKEAQPETETTEKKEESSSETDQLKNQISELEQEANKWKNDYYKVFADMENLKRRLKNGT